MTRSGYTDDCEYLDLYRSTVSRAMNGKRGQSFLREMVAAMDAIPEKVLITEALVDENGDCCAIGSVCLARGMETGSIEYDCAESVGKAMGISQSMAAEISYMNDEWSPGESPERRWKRMRSWVQHEISS